MIKFKELITEFSTIIKRLIINPKRNFKIYIKHRKLINPKVEPYIITLTKNLNYIYMDCGEIEEMQHTY